MERRIDCDHQVYLRILTHELCKTIHIRSCADGFQDADAVLSREFRVAGKPRMHILMQGLELIRVREKHLPCDRKRYLLSTTDE